jgi:uncharacterized membrane protein
MKRLRKYVFAFSVLYLTLYLPIASMTYLPGWYTLNCRFHQGCQYVGIKKAHGFIKELTDYFLHRGDLKTSWSTKEKIHLEEVRRLLDRLFIAALLFLLITFVLYDRRALSLIGLYNLCIVFSLTVVLVFFKTFWVNVFHSLLFSNDYWKNIPSDKSFYIMPREFFRNSMMAMICVSSLLNALVYFLFRQKKKSRSELVE